jgi:hypothetical protein
LNPAGFTKKVSIHILTFFLDLLKKNQRKNSASDID